MPYINIEGCEIYIPEQHNDTDVFICNKHDLYEVKEDGSKFIHGQLISRRKYERRDEWFPYSPNDFKRIIRYNYYDKKSRRTIEKKIEILHPPMYWDLNGNRLPGNGTQDPSVYKRDFNVDEFNYYSGGTFFNVACILTILTILASIFINGGWGAWFFLIPYLIYGYNKWKKYVSLYTKERK